MTVQIAANAVERTAVAKRLDVQEVSLLDAECLLERAHGCDDIQVRGFLKARVVQTCVVTLEPLPVELWADFERLYVPGWIPAMDDDAESVDPDAPDIEPLNSDTIDLGEVVVEELSLALDPYPRHPGVELEQDQLDRLSGPFSSLAALRRP